MSYVAPAGDAVIFDFVSGAAYVPPAGSAVVFDFGAPAAPDMTAQAAAVLEAVTQAATALRARVAAAALVVATSSAGQARAVATAEGGALLADVAQVARAELPAREVAVNTVLEPFVGEAAASAAALTEPNLPYAMKPLNYNLQIFQGADFTRELSWAVGNPPGPVDFTGCTARAQIRPSLQSKTVLLEMTTENGRLALELGKLTIDLSAEDTASLPPADAVYDLELVYPSGRVVRLMSGKVCVSPEVTR